jgi:hypothetical protein
MNRQARKHLRDLGVTTIQLNPDMTVADIRRKVLHYEWILSGMPHMDGHFIYPGILKDDGSRAFDEARIARCNRYHNNKRKRRYEQRTICSVS